MDLTITTGTKAQRAAFAAGVSQTIRRTVMRPLPSGTARSREGVRVTSGWHTRNAHVAVGIDLPRKAQRVTDQITEALTDAGYTVEVNPHDPLLLTVERSA